MDSWKSGTLLKMERDHLDKFVVAIEASPTLVCPAIS
jgi:hypothetical protein